MSIQEMFKNKIHIKVYKAPNSLHEFERHLYNGLSKQINHHFTGQDMFQGYLSLCNNVSNVVKLNIYVFSSTMVFRVLVMLSLKIIIGSLARVMTFKYSKNLKYTTSYIPVE